MSENTGYTWRSNVEHHHAQNKMQIMMPYYEWVLDLFGGQLDEPIADAGAGIGHFASLLSKHYDSLVLLEGGVENLDVLRERFDCNQNVEVVECDLADCENDIRTRGVRTIVTLDVLEHLPDDLKVLRQFYNALPRGGSLLIKVPAHPFLFGPVDEASGHYRRYTRATLQRVVEQAGFEVKSCKYMNFLAVPSYFLKSRILRKATNYSRTFTEKSLKRIRSLIPFIRVVDLLFSRIAGLSVICSARKV